jgi:hypothetical protein
MDINNIVTILSELIKDEATRKEIYTRILEESDEYDLEDVELGIDDSFDEVYEDMAEEDEEEEFEEDEDYEDDDEDDSSEWDDFGDSDKE